MNKVKISTIVFWLTMFPLLLPDGILYMIGIENRTMLLIRGLDLLVILCLIIIRWEKPSFPFVMISAVYFTIILSAYIHGHAPLVSFLSSNFHGLVMCAAFEYWLNNHFVKTIALLKSTLLFLIIINLATIVLSPNGLYDATYKFTEVTLASHLTYNLNWLFGYKNNQFGVVLPFLAIYCIYRICICNGFKKTSFWVFLICIIEELLAQAMMSTILITVFAVSVFVFFEKDNKISRRISKLFNLKTLMITVVIVVLGIVGMTTNSFLGDLLKQVSLAMGKDTTFNGRSAIWLVAINYIKESPVIGYGNINSETFIEESRILGGTNAHNFILHILISGGFACLAEYSIIYLYMIRFLKKNKCLIGSIMGLVIGLFFADGITSICLYYPFFNAMFILAYYAVKFYYKKNYGSVIK